MSQFGVPVLFIVFRRLDTTQRVFQQIRKVRPVRLYVASDGPRNNEEQKQVEAVRRYIMENIDWDCDLKTRFREENLGVGFGPNDAIDWFFSQEEEGIILEDDCLPSLSFFKFCEELLKLYRNNKKIGVIQGFNPFPEEDYPYSYFFSKYDLKWGWATWRDRWQYQDMYMRDWNEMKKSDFLDKISGGDRLVKYYWNVAFELIYREPWIAWDAQFTYQMLKRGMVAVVPKKNLILNIGYGEMASSTKWGIPKHISRLKLEELEFPLTHPKEIKINEEYDKKVEKIHFEINFSTVFRMNLKVFLQSNNITKKVFLPMLINLYRGYKRVKVKLSR
ncbi:MAG: nucleotide-diphospho-sugar transferase [Caldimicrobium sp.]|jgi:hypothetical protein